MASEKLKKAIEELKDNAKKVTEEAKKEDLNPKDLLSEEELNEIFGGKTEEGSGCTDYCILHG